MNLSRRAGDNYPYARVFLDRLTRPKNWPPRLALRK
jgi:hypothetical protein